MPCFLFLFGYGEVASFSVNQVSPASCGLTSCLFFSVLEAPGNVRIVFRHGLKKNNWRSRPCTVYPASVVGQLVIRNIRMRSPANGTSKLYSFDHLLVTLSFIRLTDSSPSNSSTLQFPYSVRRIGVLCFRLFYFVCSVALLVMLRFGMTCLFQVLLCRKLPCESLYVSNLVTGVKPTQILHRSGVWCAVFEGRNSLDQYFLRQF